MYATPPPTFSASLSPPATSHSPFRPPERTLDGADLEEPPPYTPSPSAYRGETTVEQGPSRPFQPAPQPPSQSQQRWPNVQHQVTSNPTGSSSLSASTSSMNRSAGSLLHQLTSTLTNSVNAAINNLNSPPLQSQQSWSSYPGRQPQQQQQQPPPQSYRPPAGPPTLSPPPSHPSSTLSRRSSEFARDFYAAGAIDEPTNAVYMPPPGSPPPPLPRRPTNITTASTSSAAPSTPNDGRPTNHPSIGHPLLKDGKLLVYPKGYECSKCHNIGYKDADPLRPCKKCWSKYAKPFSGPLVYSFSPPSPDSPSPSHSPTSTTAQNFQRPLPHPPPAQPPPIPPALSLSAPPAHFAPGGYMTNHHGGFYTPPTGVHPSQTRLGRGIGRPPPGAVVYSAGDPRIGGMLCWRCDGKGNTSFMLLDRITCPVCGGIGRTF